MSWDRKADRSEKFKKRKQSKNKGRSKKYKKELQETRKHVDDTEDARISWNKY